MLIDCHLDLNERCIQEPGMAYTTCGCGRAFVRRSGHESVCELKRGIRLLIRFASLSFVSELFRPATPSFIRMKELTQLTLRSVVHASDSLSQCVKDMRILSFKSSSSSSCSHSLPDPRNCVEAETLVYITDSLFQQIVTRETSLALVFVKEISVSVHQLNRTNFSKSPQFDLTVMEIESDVDPCLLPDLNFCSPTDSSLCLRSESSDSRTVFSCECKDRFSDLSPHPLFPGEVCRLQCPHDYCSNDGHCHVDRSSSHLYCTCNHWNVGSRCQYDGIVVVSVLAVIVLLLLLVVGCTASVFCSDRRTATAAAAAAADHQQNMSRRNISSYQDPGSRQNLVHAKPSLLSSSCPDEQIRPFRITIDNLNYGPTDARPAPGTPVVQFSPTSLAPPTHRDSCSSGQHHLVSSMSPVPSPRPSVSVAAVQTENLFDCLAVDDLQPHMSSSSLEVAVDRPARAPRTPVPAERTGTFTSTHNRDDNSISWC
jgi:hypothetical protein